MAMGYYRMRKRGERLTEKQDKNFIYNNDQVHLFPASLILAEKLQSKTGITNTFSWCTVYSGLFALI